jgi:hypothetical protein
MTATIQILREMLDQHRDVLEDVKQGRLEMDLQTVQKIHEFVTFLEITIWSMEQENSSKAATPETSPGIRPPN